MELLQSGWNPGLNNAENPYQELGKRVDKEMSSMLQPGNCPKLCLSLPSVWVILLWTLLQILFRLKYSVDRATPLSLKNSWPDVITELMRLSENKICQTWMTVLWAVERPPVLPVKNSREGVWCVARVTQQLVLGAESLLCGCVWPRPLCLILMLACVTCFCFVIKSICLYTIKPQQVKGVVTVKS